MTKDLNRLNTLFEIAKDVDPVAGAKLVSGLYVKNDLVGLGWNQSKTSPFALKYGKNDLAVCLHAEAHAIKQALRFFSVEELARAKTTLYVIRAKKPTQFDKWEWGLSKPCEGCLRSIVDFDIKRVVYSLDQTGVYEELP